MRTHSAEKRRPLPRAQSPRDFNYELDFKAIDFRRQPELYRVGKGEQGVLSVEPYKSEIVKYWKFRTPADAKKSALALKRLFLQYKKDGDFIGMDMTRKFIQMGYTRARRYANHKSGRKYDAKGVLLPFERDAEKAESAAIFFSEWKRVEADRVYAAQKLAWKTKFG